MKTSVFSRVCSTSETLNVFSLHMLKIFMVFTEKKSKFSFYYIVYMPMRASDVLINVTKQNMNVMASHSVLNM